jgi:RNA polymerase sigma-70 factor (ECF subfamily)
LKVVPPYDEKVLLQQVANGDEKAFGELFYRYSDLLSAVLLRFTNSKAITEDLVQEIFLKVWMGRESLATVDNFKPFLYVIAKNQALNAVRKAINQRDLHKKVFALTTETEDESLNKKQKEIHFSLLDEAIAQLPPQQQKAFLLSRRDKMKHREIAKEMGISQESVKKYIQIAVASIATYMKEKIPLLLLFLLR